MLLLLLAEWLVDVVSVSIGCPSCKYVLTAIHLGWFGEEKMNVPSVRGPVRGPAGRSVW